MVLSIFFQHKGYPKTSTKRQHKIKVKKKIQRHGFLKMGWYSANVRIFPTRIFWRPKPVHNFTTQIKKYSLKSIPSNSQIYVRWLIAGKITLKSYYLSAGMFPNQAEKFNMSTFFQHGATFTILKRPQISNTDILLLRASTKSIQFKIVF